MLPFSPVEFDKASLLAEKAHLGSAKPASASSSQTVTTTGWSMTMRMCIEGILRGDALHLFP
jgi:hypothetical protein